MKITASADLVPMLDPMKIVRLPKIWRKKHSVIFAWGPLQTFRGAKNIFLKDGVCGYTQAENTINPNANMGHPMC